MTPDASALAWPEPIAESVRGRAGGAPEAGVRWPRVPLSARRSKSGEYHLLVIGAGPYALSTAALARERGIDTLVLGRAMGFWRTNMPEGMFLRSEPDWHLDGAGVHTLEAYLQERNIAADEVDPIPIGVFRDYADWFRQSKGIDVPAGPPSSRPAWSGCRSGRLARDPRAIRRPYRPRACSRFDRCGADSQSASGPRRASTGSSPRRSASM